MSIDFLGDFLPFHFPSSTLLVDDHEKYLESMPLLLDVLSELASPAQRAALRSAVGYAIRQIPFDRNLNDWKPDGTISSAPE